MPTPTAAPLGWIFVDEQATFRLRDPHTTSYLYFPLLNEAGMMSVITPTGNGDVKTSQDTFLMLPVSVEDLHNTRSARNFWVSSAGRGPWSATGNSAAQIARRFGTGEDEQVTLEAGFLWHRLLRENRQLGLRAEVTNFVPCTRDRVELMQVVLTNIGSEPLQLTPTAAIPIFGRSADNLRDHRHVSSLLHRTVCHRYGIVVRPALSFDERGHLPGSARYAVLGATGEGDAPVGFFPATDAFVGEGGTLDWPEAVVRSLPAPAGAGDRVEGYEALGGLRFAPLSLEPGGAQTYVLMLAILEEDERVDALLERYGDADRFAEALAHSRAHWRAKLGTLSVTTADPRFDGWMRWVSLQPTLRRRMGNSFLPYHDYGRGGRGWRDLWQDILALLIMDSADVGDALAGYFAGVRFDGSNATIIGSRPGDFRADRNDIPRVWMDHGAWPLLTTRLYIDQTGDLAFLLRRQPYFKDHLSHRCRQVDEDWQPEQGTVLKDDSGEPYLGSVLEHLLIQHLVPFFNVGDHNIMLLEDADWNDGLDMARQRGESVAFTALYAWNLRQLCEMVLALKRLAVDQVEVAGELLMLLDTLQRPLSYASAQAKRWRLDRYFDAVRAGVSGVQVRVGLEALAADLAAKADWLFDHLRTQEWIVNAEGHGWFNGYYDDDGRRVEGDHPLGVRMTLTGQVFALMGGIATDAQAQSIVRAAGRYLHDERVGGYRLNSDFGDAVPALGRAFGYAFGHKENGAMFSHMAVMFAYALYRRGLVAEGWQVLERIYRHSQDFAVSRMYPGIPEYFDARGRGMYPYLTGSASWYLLTLVSQAFGVQGDLGDLVLAPKLVRSQFDGAGQASITTLFADRRLEIVYLNASHLDWDGYRVGAVAIDGAPVPVTVVPGGVSVARDVISALSSDEAHRIEVRLVR